MPDTMTLIFLAIMAFIITYMVVSALKSRQEPIKRKRTITLLQCVRGDHEEKRDFREGDYVGKKEGSCPKCGSDLIIKAIYVEEIPEELRPQRRF